MVCVLMCSWLAIIGLSGCSVADRHRYGTRANTTIAATAG